ncbi:MAG: hypothetical protein HOO99_19375 [Hyphomicrobiaceae bacterium]|nr:hypothetical protein [Hyphomicrobiaceae bacterium]
MAADFLDDAEIKRDVVGSDFAGHYADGRPWQEHYHVDEKLVYTEAGRSVDGYWTLKEGMFCTLYRGALSGGCWRLKRIGTNCFEFYDAGAADRGAAARRLWTARGWRKEMAPTCGAPQIS